MNYCTFTGRLTKKAELVQTQNGYDVLRFSIANNEGWGDKEQVNYFDCNIWGKRAVSLEPYLTKGLKVVVSGRMRMSTSEKDGIKRQYYTLNVGELEFMSNKRKSETPAPTTQAPAQVNEPKVTQRPVQGQANYATDEIAF